MSSKKEKKVHYERGTKGGKSQHSYRSSRDSGVGSSSASDRASLGTAPEDSTFSFQQIEDQRHILSVVQEALDAANEKVKKLESNNDKLNGLLADSNKENRLLKREKNDLLDKIQDLMEDLDYERTQNRRESSPRNGAAAPAASRPTERRSTPPRRERESHREEERSQGSRTNWREQPVPLYHERTAPPPSAPQPPPNPFTPISARPATVSYAPTAVTYAPAHAVTYAPSPVFAPATIQYPQPNTRYPEDGRYHPHPL